jgi:dUTP pyrophosphatase
MDVRAQIDQTLYLNPGNFAAISTGLSVEIPKGYEIQVRPRSGLALKYGVTVLNTPGTIDSDYRGEIKIILINLGNKIFATGNGDRIAQLVVAPVMQARIEEVAELSQTDRGSGGFGHTG